tara:strand:- start:24 stop:608 length:585 start_codon:yes stop_codon:yes gene_type:complete
MKTFFTQPIGQLGRQNSLGFIGLNVVLLVVGFGELDIPVGLGNLLNFLWGFSLFSIILAGYYLVKDQVPDYWREASAILGGVILVGTLIEISSPDYTINNGGFSPMYFLWAFNSLIYVLTMRGSGVFRPVYEYLSAFGYISIIIFSGANVFFDYEIPESIQPIFGLGWIAMVIGLGYGGYVAWGDKLASSEGVE